MPTIKEMKQTLIKNKARWAVSERLLDTQEIPKFHTGGLKENLPKSEDIKAVDFKKIFAIQPNNPFILARRMALGIVPRNLVSREFLSGSSPQLAPGKGAGAPGGPSPTNVDWRNRWGWPWITNIRDQNGCEACWVFSAVALVEAMVRIEHCAWPWLSEGDVHKGYGAKCCDCGFIGNSLDWIKNNGVADPGCYAWPVTSAWCGGCGTTGGAPYDTVPYTPTGDRDGRSVKIPAYTPIGSVADQKKWLDTVGPIIAWFAVWADFGSYGTGVYHKQNMIGSTPNTQVGGHYLLVVGYDDAQCCWIVKNSWGTSWGQSGFGLFGYGECDIDASAKLGLTGTNPDPWTKRRMHSGCMLESGNGGQHRNFEMVTTAPDRQLRHWWRDNSAAGFPWNKAELFNAPDAAACPTIIESTYHRNFEIIYPTTDSRLHHWFFEQSSLQWKDGGVFGPTNTAGIPGFIQSNYNAPGNFDVVVRTSDNMLAYWYRVGGGPWSAGTSFGNNIAYSGASLVQSHYFNTGNFELVCVLGTGEMQHWWRDNDHGMTWNAGPTFGNAVKSPPCMIEGQFGASDEKAVGNFELCVAVDGKVEHWWRANWSDMVWQKSTSFGHDVKSVVALVEGSYGFNLEVIVLRNDNRLQHYWRYGAGDWYEGPVIGNA